ncbi:MAG: DUF4388 domain-containing protein [bacterium]|nr:DUF4388 domain-containing protein [bacterium]
MKKKLILVVISKAELSPQLEKSLQDDGFDVVLVDNGKEGYNVARQIKPDLIISSHQFGALDGIDFCYLIKNNISLSTTPFVLYSHYLNRDQRIEAYRNGVDAIVNTSIPYRELIARIENLISNFQSLARHRQTQTHSLVGKINDFSLIEILQLLNMNQKTGILTVYNDLIDGQIAFKKGEMTYALVENYSGEEAVIEMMGWQQGLFLFEKDAIETNKNIDKPSMQLILDCCQILDETKTEFR